MPNVKERKLKAKRELMEELTKKARMRFGSFYKRFRNLRIKGFNFVQILGARLARQKRQLRLLKIEERTLFSEMGFTVSTRGVKTRRYYMKRINALLQSKIFYDAVAATARSELNIILFRIAQQLDQYEKFFVKKSISDTGREILDPLLRKPFPKELFYKELYDFNNEIQIFAGIRDEILHLLIERTRFIDLMEVALRTINKGKMIILDLLEQGNIIFEKIEKIVSKSANITTYAKERTNIYKTIVKRLLYAIANERRKMQVYRNQNRIIIQKGIYPPPPVVDVRAVKNTMKDRIHKLRLYCQRFVRFYLGNCDTEDWVRLYNNEMKENFVIMDLANLYACEAEYFHHYARNDKHRYSLCKRSKVVWVQQHKDIIRSLLVDKYTSLLFKGFYGRENDELKAQTANIRSILAELYSDANIDTAQYKRRLVNYDQLHPAVYKQCLILLEDRLMDLIGRVVRREKRAHRNWQSLPLHVPIVRRRGTLLKRELHKIRNRLMFRPNELQKLEGFKPPPKYPKFPLSLRESPCPLCAQSERMMAFREFKDTVTTRKSLMNIIGENLQDRARKKQLHALSKCRLPEARFLYMMKILTS